MNLLTPSQFRVLSLLSQGNNSPKIAELLFTSVSAVRKHRERIIAKLDLNNQDQRDQDVLTRYAVRLEEVLKPFAEITLASRKPIIPKK